MYYIHNKLTYMYCLLAQKLVFSTLFTSMKMSRTHHTRRGHIGIPLIIQAEVSLSNQKQEVCVGVWCVGW